MKQFFLLIFFFFFLFSLSFYGFFWYKYERKVFSIDSRVSNLKNTNSFGEGFQNVGWIKVQGTNIDYPVINSYGDALDYPVAATKYGWVIERDTKNDDIVHVNGHNVFNLGSHPKTSSEDFERFEELMNFVYYDFAKENKYIQYTIGEKDYLYKVFAVNFLLPSDMFTFIRMNGEYTKEEIKKQIQFYQKESLYKYDINVNEEDKILSLITCTRLFGYNAEKKSIFVQARRLRENEKVNDYDVTIQDNVYSEIKDILESGDKDE